MFGSLIDSVKPYDGTRFSGLLTTYDVSDYQEVVDRLNALASKHNFTPCSENSVWINVMRGVGARIEEHSEGRHKEDHTLVLFLTTLEVHEGGLLCLPRRLIKPVEGEFALFPSRVFHSVSPLKVDKPRVSIAGLFHKTRP